MSCFAPVERSPSPTLPARIVATEEDIATTVYLHQRAMERACENTLTRRFRREIRPIQKALREERRITGRFMGYPVGAGWIVTESGFKVQRSQWDNRGVLESPPLSRLTFNKEFSSDNTFWVEVEPPRAPPRRRERPNPVVTALEATGHALASAAIYSAVAVVATIHNLMHGGPR